MMKGPIARGTIRTTIVLALRLTVQAGTLLIVARLLGPHYFGAFAGVASSAVILGTLSAFGTHLVLLERVSREPAKRETVLAYALPTTLLCGSGLLAIYLLVTRLALGPMDVSLCTLAALGTAEMLLQPLIALPVNEHLALGHIARSQLLSTLPLALRLAAAAAALLFHSTDPLATYAYGYFGASAIALVLASSTIPDPWPRLRNWRLPKKHELREAVGYAALGLTATSPAELDKTLAAKLLPLATAGVYAAGARVIGAATLPIVAMLLSALPRLFREGQSQPKRTASLLRWILGVTLAYSVAVAVLLWFLAPVIGWIFGAKYHGLGEMVRWLCVAVPGMALRVAAGSVLLTLGRPWMRVGFEAAGMVILTVTSLILTSRYGSIGMPLALAGSEWGMTIIGILCIRQAQSHSDFTHLDIALSPSKRRL